MPVINSIERERFFIDGQWRKASTSDLAPVFEAATERPLGVAAMGGPEEIDAAVHAARAALQKGPWGRSTPHERATVMRRFADSLERRGRSTAELVSRQTGMISSLSVSTSATAPVAILRSMADLIETRTFETRRPSSMGSTIVREEPVGVVGAITAWNYPQLLAMAKIGPALAAGCTVVLKPAPETSLDAMYSQRQPRKPVYHLASSTSLPAAFMQAKPCSPSRCRQDRLHRFHCSRTSDRRGRRPQFQESLPGARRKIRSHCAPRCRPRRLCQKPQRRRAQERGTDMHHELPHLGSPR